MYIALVYLHSLFRWFALSALMYASLLSIKGFLYNEQFTALHNRVRHWSATVIHIQFAIGMLLYFQLPRTDIFFKMIHPLIMFIVVVSVTLGSSLTKRRQHDHGKFKTWMTFYIVALVLMLLAIPWPFAPWAARPLLRTF